MLLVARFSMTHSSWIYITAAVVALSANPVLAQGKRDVKSGGVLSVALLRQAECIDPQQDNYGYGSNEGRLLVDSLTDQSYDEPSKIVPWLAESWTVNEDATQYEFKLRSGVTFSDGTKFDAQIVKDNFE